MQVYNAVSFPSPYPPWFAFPFGYEFPDNGDNNVLVDDYY